MSGEVAGAGELAAMLLTTQPPEFIAARNALVKELRGRGERDQAKAVGALRKPSWPEWALNSVVPDQLDAVERFADAAGAMQHAQASAEQGKSGGDLRATMRELRDATAELARLAAAALRAAGRSQDATSVTGRLGEVAASGAEIEQLRRGLLGAGHEPDGGLFSGVSSPGGAKAGGGTRSKTGGLTRKRSTASTKASAKAADDGRTDELAKRRRQRELQRAERDRDSAKARLDRLETELADAEANVESAQAALERAEAARDKAIAKRDQSASHLEAAESALAAATDES